MKPPGWLRHTVTLPVVAAGVWYGVEAGSRGGLLAAGAAAIAWLVWPEARRLRSWRDRRRAERTRRRYVRRLERAERSLAKAERARTRADRRPTRTRLARRAEQLEAQATRAVAHADRARERHEALASRQPKG